MHQLKLKQAVAFCAPPNFMKGLLYLVICEGLVVVLFQIYHSVIHDNALLDRIDTAVLTVVISLPLLILWLCTMSYQYKLTLQLENLAHTDTLTGLPNRRAFVRSTTKSEVFTSDGVLLNMDIDHFKQVNDLHGHFVGDSGLVAVAQLLTKKLHPSAVTARIGGDEFISFLPNCSIADANEIACALSAGTKFSGTYGVVALSLSIGAFPVSKGDRFSTMLRKADDAMYQAKSLGGARLVFGPDEMPDRRRAPKPMIGSNVYRRTTTHWPAQNDPTPKVRLADHH